MTVQGAGLKVQGPGFRDERVSGDQRVGNSPSGRLCVQTRVCVRARESDRDTE